MQFRRSARPFPVDPGKTHLQPRLGRQPLLNRLMKTLNLFTASRPTPTTNATRISKAASVNVTPRRILANNVCSELLTNQASPVIPERHQNVRGIKAFNLESDGSADELLQIRHVG